MTKEIFIIIFMIFSLIIEAIMLIVLSVKISKFHQLSLKDTIIYPFLVLLTIGILWTLIGHYDHAVWYEDLIRSIKDSIGVVKLDLDSDLLDLLKATKGVGYLAMVSYYGAYIISFLALFSLAFTLARKTVMNTLSSIGKLSLNEKTYVFGFNEDAKNFIKGLKNDNRKKIIVILDSSVLNKYVDEILYLNEYKISYKKKPYGKTDEIIKTLKKLSKNKKKKYHFVTFFDDDAKNVSFIVAAKRYLKEINAFGSYSFNDVENINCNNAYLLKFNDKVKTNKIIVNGGEVLFSKKNRLAIKTGNSEIKLEPAEKDQKYNSNIYLIDPNSLKSSDNGTNINIVNGLGSDEDYSYKKYSISFKPQRNIFIKVFCSNIQKPVLDEIIRKRPDNEETLNSAGEITDTFDASRGMIKAINKYDVIAYDFIIKNSFARFLDDDNIDTDSTIRNCDINLYVLGFGKVNKALTRDVLINNQFAEKIPGEQKNTYKLKIKRMNVKIYEKKKEIDDDLSFSFIKYDKNKFKGEYYDLPDNFINKNDFKIDNRFDDTFLNDIYDVIKEKTKS
ncbi:MAG: hypothetical protein K6A63_05500, partial [Acholeplasmatales bacterium]|nr:hypothetical protein [Acholeplasmatales bacterium]